jgi:hypothetical protein
MKNYSLWLHDFMESWKNLEGVKTTELFADDVEYYETPMEKPCATFDDVKALWSVVSHNQKVLDYNIEIILSDDEQCVANWQLSRINNETGEKQKFDGIFLIKLNDNNKLTYFKQWRYIENLK